MSQPNPTAETVLRFLESVGRPSEAELYLRLFRDLPRHGFGIVAAEASLVQDALPSLVESLRFLSALHLHPLVLLGAFEPERVSGHGDDVARALQGASLEPVLYEGSAEASTLARDLDAARAPVLQLSAETTQAQRIEQIASLAADLGTRKLVVLRAKGGLHLAAGRSPNPEQLIENVNGQVTMVNLSTDRVALDSLLDTEDGSLLTHLAKVLAHPGCTSLAVSVASPLELLRELFTVRGSGTLVKRGSSLSVVQGYSALDLERLGALLQSTFGRPLRRTFFDDDKNVEVVVEEAYRGAAIVETGTETAYLSKFAVERAAQGEGIGRDLWAAVIRRHPRMCWRARRDNNAVAWYLSLCDGMVKSGRWCVFFRGIEESHIAETVRQVSARQDDFLVA